MATVINGDTGVSQVQSNIALSAPTLAVGTNTTQVATTANVYASVNRFGGAISAAVTLTKAQSGAKFWVSGATAAFNITLPALEAGLNFEFFGVNGAYAVGLTYAGGLLWLPDGTTAAAGTFSQINLANQGNTIRVWSDGGGWFMSTLGQEIVKNGVLNNQAVNLGQFNRVGTAPMYVCRAWVNFNGTTSPITIRASGNVSSITDNGVGDYTVNFTTAMPDANCGVVTGGNRSGDVPGAEASPNISASNLTATSVHIGSQDNNTDGYQDSVMLSVAIFR